MSAMRIKCIKTFHCRKIVCLHIYVIALRSSRTVFTITHIEFLCKKKKKKKRRENKLHTGFECGFEYVSKSCIISDAHAYNFRLKLYIVCPNQIKTLYISKVMIYSTRDYKVEFAKNRWTNKIRNVIWNSSFFCWFWRAFLKS